MKEHSAAVTLGGGCFWCLEAVYDELEGITNVVSGFAGGPVPNPDYQSVIDGNTGHVEVVQVAYDPEIIGFSEILEVFFSIHDPTTVDRQGVDVGDHYRSAIFYHSEDQKIGAEHMIETLETEEIWADPIVTQVTALEVFYPAEEIHQDYYKRNPFQGYCQVSITPKLAKFRNKFTKKLKTRV